MFHDGALTWTDEGLNIAAPIRHIMLELTLDMDMSCYPVSFVEEAKTKFKIEGNKL
jgi:hypothetical protein